MMWWTKFNLENWANTNKIPILYNFPTPKEMEAGAEPIIKVACCECDRSKIESLIVRSKPLTLKYEIFTFLKTEKLEIPKLLIENKDTI